MDWINRQGHQLDLFNSIGFSGIFQEDWTRWLSVDIVIQIYHAASVFASIDIIIRCCDSKNSRCDRRSNILLLVILFGKITVENIYLLFSQQVPRNRNYYEKTIII